jgi:hypothetical protein
MATMFNNMVKSYLRSILPRSYLPGVYVRKRTGMQVVGGCFAGLSYVGEAVGSALIPKLLGTYERELGPVVDEIVRGRFEEIIDIGAAEGYYAVGLARLVPNARVHAFEMTEHGRALLSEMAIANGVADRVLIKGKCDAPDLRDCLGSSERPVVICDVEGYEGELLDIGLVPSLVHAFVLVEIHETLCPGVRQSLRTRFQSTHQIEEIYQEERSTADFPFRTLYTRLLPDRVLLDLMNEWRPEGMTWFYMRPRAC